MFHYFRAVLKNARRLRLFQNIQHSRQKEESALKQNKSVFHSKLITQTKSRGVFYSIQKLFHSSVGPSFSRNISTLVRRNWFNAISKPKSNRASRLVHISMGLCALSLQQKPNLKKDETIVDMAKDIWNENHQIEASTFSIIHQLAHKKIQEEVFQLENVRQAIQSQVKQVSDLTVDTFIGKGCDGAVYRAKLPPLKTALPMAEASSVVVKLLFNYESSQNNRLKLLFHSEVQPLRQAIIHPNIIFQFTEVEDSMCNDWPEAKIRFPQALHNYFDQSAYGRSRTKYVLMEELDQTLEEFILKSEHIDFTTVVTILLQLLEALIFLNKKGIAHRDIKLNNILVKHIHAKGKVFPRIVLTDFGHCACDLDPYNMKLAYPNPYVCRGGNISLMAPEIALAQPGLKAMLDYSKSDLWSVGTLVYDLLKMPNPFCHEPIMPKDSLPVDLPPLRSVPIWFDRLVRFGLLTPSVEKRLSAEACADILHVFLLKSSNLLQEVSNFSGMMWCMNEFWMQQNRLEWVIHRLFFSRLSSSAVYLANFRFLPLFD